MFSDDLRRPTSSHYPYEDTSPHHPGVPFRHVPGAQPPSNWRPRPSYVVLKTCYLDVERKTFRLELQKNHLGKCVRITELSASKKTAIIIPADGLREVTQAVAELLRIMRADSIEENSSLE